MHCVTIYKAAAKVRRLEVFRFALLSEGVLLIAPAASITPYTRLYCGMTQGCRATWWSNVSRISINFPESKKKKYKYKWLQTCARQKYGQTARIYAFVLPNSTNIIANDYGWACERCSVRAYEVIDTIILFRSCNNVKPLPNVVKEQASTAYGCLSNCSAVSS